MPQEVKVYKKDGQLYDVPAAEIKDFLIEVPGAVEVNVYEKDGTTYDVPLGELDDFIREVPGASLLSGSKKKVSLPTAEPIQEEPPVGSIEELPSPEPPPAVQDVTYMPIPLQMAGKPISASPYDYLPKTELADPAWAGDVSDFIQRNNVSDQEAQNVQFRGLLSRDTKGLRKADWEVADYILSEMRAGRAVLAGQEPEAKTPLQKIAAKGPGYKYALNYLKGVNEDIVSMLKAMDGVEVTLSNYLLAPEGMKGLPLKGETGFGQWAKSMQQSIDENWPETERESLVGKMTYDLGAITSFIGGLMLTPQAKIGNIAIGKMAPFMGVKEFGVSMSEEGKLGKASLAGAKGVATGLSFELLGAFTGKTAAITQKKLTPLIGAAALDVANVSKVLTGGGGFGAYTATGQIFDKGKVYDWGEVAASAAVGSVLTTQGIAEYVFTRSFNDYLNTSFADAQMLRRADKTSTRMRKDAADLRKKAGKEELGSDAQKEALIESRMLDKSASVVEFEVAVERNPDQVIDLVKADKKLPEVEKEKIIEDITGRSEHYIRQAEVEADASAREVKRPDGEPVLKPTKEGKYTVEQKGETGMKKEFDTKEQAQRFLDNFKTLTEGERTFEEQRKITEEKAAAGEAKKVEPVVAAEAKKESVITEKPTKDAVQKPKAEKVDVEKPPPPREKVGEEKVEPPAKIPPEPPGGPPPELPEGPKKPKDTRTAEQITKEIRVTRAGEMKKRKKASRLRLSYILWDQQEPFKREIQKAAKKADKGEREAQTVLDRKNTEKGSKAWTSHEFSVRVKGAIGKFFDQMPQGEIDLVSEYNSVRRINELYKSREAFGKEKRKEEGGRTREQAEQFLLDVRNKEPWVLKEFGLKDYDFKRFKETSDKFNDMYRDVLDEMLDNNIITKAGYDQIVIEHPYYSPFKFIEHMDQIDGKGAVSGVQSLKGGSEGAMMTDALSLYYDALSRKNNLISRARTMRAMDTFVDKVDPKFMRKAKLTSGYAKKLKAQDQLLTEQPGAAEKTKREFIEPEFEPTPKGMESLDYIDNSGQRKRFFMDAEVHKYFDIEPFSDMSRKAMNWAGWLSGTKVLKAFATGYNPEFLVKNIPIDMVHILNTTNVYSGALPIATKQMLADMAKVSGDVTLRKGRYIDYLKEGGGMEMMTHQGQLREGVSQKKFSKPMQVLEGFENTLSYLGKSSELITRLALRERHLENAKRDYLIENNKQASPERLKEMQLDATAYARNYLDFEQGGRLTKVVDSVIPYLNAGLQVTRGSVRAAGKNPALYTAKLAQLSVAATALTAWNMGLQKSEKMTDEDLEGMRNSYLNDISNEVKARNHILMTPMYYYDAGGAKRYIYRTFQKDNLQELVAGVAETRVHRQVMGEDYEGYLSMRRLKELQVMTESFANVAQLPPAARALLGYKLNTDLFYKSDIWGGRDFGRDKSFEFRADTPERYKALGKVGTPWGKPSPVRSQYVAKQFFTESNVLATGIGELVDKALGGIDRDLKTEYTPGEIEKLKNRPFERRFTKATYPGAAKRGEDTRQQEYNRIKKENDDKLNGMITSGKGEGEVYEWLGSMYDPEKSEMAAKSMAMANAEFGRLNRSYENKVIKPQIQSWLRTLKYTDAIPRGEELFDAWVQESESMRSVILEEAAKAGILSDGTVSRWSELVEEYEAEAERMAAGKTKNIKD